MSLPEQPPPTAEFEASIVGTASKTSERAVIAWALWDWGSAAFNAVVTTFVFSTYLASSYFVDPAIVEASGGDDKYAPLVRAEAENASTIGFALMIAGILIALLAPVLGQRSDGTGKRKLWLAINTFLCVASMAAMFFVEGSPGFLVLGAALLAAGNIFFEFGSVNYNAMLVQISTRENMGRVSGFGWGMGYLGGIVLLILLLVFFIQSFGTTGAAGLTTVPTENGFNIRVAIVVAAIWFGVFGIPVLIRVPELQATKAQKRVGFFRSYGVLAHTIAKLWHTNRQVLLFLLASAVFRDGLAGVFTFGAIIAVQVFKFSSAEVMYFAVAANLIAGVFTITSGRFDDRFGPKTVIVASLIGLVAASTVVLFIGSAPVGFWIVGLTLCAFVGPVQSASRSFLARITPVGREGEIFGLYATTGRAVSFMSPALFGIFVATTGDTRFGILGLLIVLGAGLLLMLPVRTEAARID